MFTVMISEGLRVDCRICCLDLLGDPHIPLHTATYRSPLNLAGSDNSRSGSRCLTAGPGLTGLQDHCIAYDKNRHVAQPPLPSASSLLHSKTGAMQLPRLMLHRASHRVFLRGRGQTQEERCEQTEAWRGGDKTKYNKNKGCDWFYLFIYPRTANWTHLFPITVRHTHSRWQATTEQLPHQSSMFSVTVTLDF